MMNKKNYTRETIAEAFHQVRKKHQLRRATSGGYSMKDCREAVGLVTKEEKANRICLLCRGVFLSDHKFHRTCSRCKIRKACD